MRDLSPYPVSNCRRSIRLYRKIQAEELAGTTGEPEFIPFTALSPLMLKDKMHDLFYNLVTKLLLLVPMAENKFIHPNIRPGWKTTYNILCQYDPYTSKIELRLIDYEIFVIYPIQSSTAGRCIPTYHCMINSAYDFFLVASYLHMVYIWYKQLDNDNHNTYLGMVFVYKILDPDEVKFADFRHQCGVTDWTTMNKD